MSYSQNIIPIIFPFSLMDLIQTPSVDPKLYNYFAEAPEKELAIPQRNAVQKEE